MSLLHPVLRRARFAAVVHAADQTIREWNAGAEKLFGFTAAEAVGQKIPGLLGAKRAVVSKDGKRLFCLWQEEALDDGSTLAIVTDVTESRVRARLLQGVMDNLKVVVWQMDTAGTFTFHDGRKALEGLGVAPGSVIGQNLFALYGENVGKVVRSALAGKPITGLDEAHGMSWETYTLPLRDTEGKIDGVAGISLDVTESKVRERELQAKIDLIEAQEQTIRQLSIPLIETWEGVLTVPMVGEVDTGRASEIMEQLLTEITRRKARFAIVDLTGVDEVDADVAGHIIGLARSIKLLGAEGIVTGIHPAMAQTMVQLGVDLSGIRTLANVREALAYCMARARAL